MPQFKTSELSTAENYKYLIASICPRPIGLISTLNLDGSVNLAPYSSLNLVASNPASLSFSVSVKPDGSKKDTLVNIERSKEFVVNSAQTTMLKQVALSGASFAYGSSELEKTGLKSCKSSAVTVPGLQESFFRMECELIQIVQVGSGQAGTAFLVIGHIKVFHFADSIMQNGRIDFEKLDMLSRLGGHWYANLGERFEEAIPAV